MPWDDLADAFDRFAEAERGGDADDIALSLANLNRAKEHVAALGNLLLLFALKEPGSVAQAKLLDLFSRSSQAAWDRATRAARRAAWAIAELDALKCRVRELEEWLARLTLGVGEPQLRIVG